MADKMHTAVDEAIKTNARAADELSKAERVCSSKSFEPELMESRISGNGNASTWSSRCKTGERACFCGGPIISRKFSGKARMLLESFCAVSEVQNVGIGY